MDSNRLFSSMRVRAVVGVSFCLIFSGAVWVRFLPHQAKAHGPAVASLVRTINLGPVYVNAESRGATAVSNPTRIPMWYRLRAVARPGCACKNESLSCASVNVPPGEVATLSFAYVPQTVGAFHDVIVLEGASDPSGAASWNIVEPEVHLAGVADQFLRFEKKIVEFTSLSTEPIKVSLTAASDVDWSLLSIAQSHPGLVFAKVLKPISAVPSRQAVIELRLAPGVDLGVASLGGVTTGVTASLPSSVLSTDDKRGGLFRDTIEATIADANWCITPPVVAAYKGTGSNWQSSGPVTIIASAPKASAAESLQGGDWAFSSDDSNISINVISNRDLSSAAFQIRIELKANDQFDGAATVRVERGAMPIGSFRVRRFD